MSKASIIPAQIRAARALVNWSQEQLADAAAVALSSVRDIESQKRANKAGTVGSIRRALENEGVVFIPGTSSQGPGVRLVGNRPNIIRRPTMLTSWDGMPLTVEWQGRAIIVMVSQEVLEDLGHLKGDEPHSVYLATFESHRESILEGIINAAASKANYDRHGRLHVREKDVPALK